MIFGGTAEARAHWVVVDVIAMVQKIGSVADAMIGESLLPDRIFVGETMGEAALDKHHRSFERGVLRR